MQYFVRIIEFLKHHLTKGSEIAASWVKLDDAAKVGEKGEYHGWHLCDRLSRLYHDTSQIVVRYIRVGGSKELYQNELTKYYQVACKSLNFAA